LGRRALATTTLDVIADTHTKKLIDEGELKTEFNDALGDNAEKIYLTGKHPDAGDPAIQAIVCFDPDSKSLSADATTAYDNGGDPGSGCPDVAAVCYWCVR